MKLLFEKYQGTGNDFLIADNRQGHLKLTIAQVKKICDRRFGVGADGLMLLEEARGADFKMIYYNADGNLSSMCGNGGRCLAHYARKLGAMGNTGTFVAVDGSHRVRFKDGKVLLGMNSVKTIAVTENTAVLDTGSPHLVKFVTDASAVNVYEEGRTIRQNETYRAQGINVNFVETTSEGLYVRTYERGVEAETLSCGTGVTASALAHHALHLKSNGNFSVKIETPGGHLVVHFSEENGHYQNVVLEGPATFVFAGEIEI